MNKTRKAQWVAVAVARMAKLVHLVQREKPVLGVFVGNADCKESPSSESPGRPVPLVPKVFPESVMQLALVV